jgi:hypothetical protein
VKWSATAFQDQGGLSWTRADGAGKPQALTRTRGIAFPWSFTPDGKRLAYIELDPGTAYELWTVPLDSDGTGLRAGKPEAILQNPAIDQGQRDEDAIQPN